MSTSITANGINFPNGSAGTPSVAGSDTDTGLFYGTDIVGFATGGSERLRIDASGNINIANDSGKLQLGTSADLKFYHDGSHSNIVNSTGELKIRGAASQAITFRNSDDSANVAVFNIDDATHLYFDSAHKFSTTSTGIKVVGNCLPTSNDSGQLGTSSVRWQELNITDVIDVSDNGKIRMGDSDDLQLWHNSSTGNSNISGINGNLYLQGNNGSGTAVNQIAIISNGAVELNYQGNKKLETTSGGVDISGTTDGMLNLNTTDARGPFIRYQVSGTSKVFAGCGEGLGLGSEDDFGIRTDAHLRIRTGTEEHAMLTDEGFFAAKGMAGGWVGSQSPASTQSHQFNNTGVSKWVCQFQQQHHAGFGVQILGNSTSNSEAFVIYSNSNNTTRFRVYWDGNCANANNSFGSLSDISIKENIVDAKSQWDDIKAVKVRNFNLKNDPDTKMLGVVAQEIETVSPKLVWEDREGLKGVSYSVLYMKAIKCLQEAMVRIETLETEKTKLQTDLTNLTTRVTALEAE